MPVRQALTILAVSDLARAVRFYRALLGWPVRVEVPVFVQLKAPGEAPDLALYQREAFAANTGQPSEQVPPGALSATELYFYPDDLAASIARVEALGGRLLSALGPRSWGDEVAYYADPDGNVVALARHAADDEAVAEPARGVQRHASASPYEAQTGFCRALRAGRRILVAGTAPIGPGGESVAPGDAGAQMRRCLTIADEALQALGGSLRDVVRTRMFLTHAEDWEAVAAAHGEAFAEVRPVATCVVVAGLLRPEWRVELELEALLPEG